MPERLRQTSSSHSSRPGRFPEKAAGMVPQVPPHSRCRSPRRLSGSALDSASHRAGGSRGSLKRAGAALRESRLLPLRQGSKLKRGSREATNRAGVRQRPLGKRREAANRQPHRTRTTSRCPPARPRRLYVAGGRVGGPGANWRRALARGRVGSLAGAAAGTQYLQGGCAVSRCRAAAAGAAGAPLPEQP